MNVQAQPGWIELQGGLGGSSGQSPKAEAEWDSPIYQPPSAGWVVEIPPGCGACWPSLPPDCDT